MAHALEVELDNARLAICEGHYTREEERAASYDFSADWYHSFHLCNWRWLVGTLYAPYSGGGDGCRGSDGARASSRQPAAVLEVGVFEGRTATWLLENLLATAGSSYVGIEPGFAVDLDRTRENLRRATAVGGGGGGGGGGGSDGGSGGGVLVQLLEERSDVALPRLLSEVQAGRRPPFDLAFVDGEHTRQGALFDVVVAWRALRPGGLLIVDDYFVAGPPAHLGPAVRAAVDDFIEVRAPRHIAVAFCVLRASDGLKAFTEHGLGGPGYPLSGAP